MATKNITVSVDEETHRQARIRAAELGLSLSALVRLCLRDLCAQPAPPTGQQTSEHLDNVARRGAALSKLLDDWRAKGGDLDPSENPTREELYEQVLKERALVRDYLTSLRSDQERESEPSSTSDAERLEQRRQRIQAAVDNITSNGGGLLISEIQSRDELYDEAWRERNALR